MSRYKSVYKNNGIHQLYKCLSGTSLEYQTVIISLTNDYQINLIDINLK